ncbi:hypothetical protein APSETT444_003956 [Aspergillus pseudonomiae]
MSHPQPALDVFFYFQKQELKLSFNSPNQAASYQNRNRESRIFANEPSAVYLPLAPSMVYLRDSSKGLVIGFAKSEDADLWCRTSILGQKHGHYEVHIGRGWTDEQLNQALQIQHQPYVPKSNSRPQNCAKITISWSCFTALIAASRNGYASVFGPGRVSSIDPFLTHALLAYLASQLYLSASVLRLQDLVLTSSYHQAGGFILGQERLVEHQLSGLHVS